MAKQKKSSLYNYQALEFDKYEKTPTWYALFGIIGVLLLVYAIFTRSPMMFVVFVLTFVVTLLISSKDPEYITVEITETGINLDSKRTFQFQDIESFGVFIRQDVRFISLHMAKGVLTHTRIPLGKENPDDIADILEQFIPREDGKESFFDTLDHFLKI
jgi:hypothetical protein